MSYSDVQMIIASQIAYMDFAPAAVNSGKHTVKELLEMEMEGAEEKRKSEIQKLLDRINENAITQKCGEWRIRDIRDNQSTSGMYACLLETGDGNAMVAFRGSESENLDDICKDWIASDLGLVNNLLTPQQATAQKYMEDIYREYGDEYASFAMTGHSLGGNLAEHAAIAAPEGMRDKIIQCVNLDGPGYSQQYLIAHANDIEKASDVITHYQWSWCGGLLTPVPGSNYKTIEADTPRDGSLLNNMLWRHDTYNVVNFDENGNAIPAERDWFASILSPLAIAIDFSIFLLAGNAGIALLYNAADVIRDTFQNLWESWERIRVLGNQKVQFEININTVNNELDELLETVPQMRSIQEGVEKIQRELAFDSIAAGYVKIKLWNIANNIEWDVKKMGAYCEKGRECTRCYKTFEQTIVDNYG